MDVLLNSVLGIVSIILGFFLIDYYNKLVKTKETGGFSFKLRTAGIGLIIIGIGLIVRACNIIFN